MDSEGSSSDFVDACESHFGHLFSSGATNACELVRVRVRTRRARKDGGGVRTSIVYSNAFLSWVEDDVQPERVYGDDARRLKCRVPRAQGERSFCRTAAIQRQCESNAVSVQRPYESGFITRTSKVRNATNSIRPSTFCMIQI